MRDGSYCLVNFWLLCVSHANAVSEAAALRPPLKGNLLSQCHSLHRLQFPIGTVLRSPIDGADISPLGTLAELGEITGTLVKRNHHRQLTYNSLLGLSSHSPWDFSPPQTMTYIYFVFICANIYLHFFSPSSSTFAIPLWIMHLTGEKNAISSILPVGCAYHPWPTARRGRRWSTTPQLWFMCLTEILKKITWVKLWNTWRNTEEIHYWNQCPH